MVEVCDDRGCRMQPREAVTARLAGDAHARRQLDPEAYRGEPVAALREAAAAGDARAAHRLGQALEARGDLAGAARAYAPAAEAGLPFAAFRLAQLVQRGAAPGGPPRARELTEVAAAGGVAQAAHNMGALAQRARNPAEAARWFSTAAENGVPESQHALALMLFQGDGVPRDPFGGVTWMRRAAQNGHAPAQMAMGRLGLTGLEEMGQDLNEAQTWLTAAAGQGDREAARLLPQVEAARAAQAQARLAFQRQLVLQREQTRALFGAVILAQLLAPPPVVIVNRGFW